MEAKEAIITDMAQPIVEDAVRTFETRNQKQDDSMESIQSDLGTQIVELARDLEAKSASAHDTLVAQIREGVVNASAGIGAAATRLQDEIGGAKTELESSFEDQGVRRTRGAQGQQAGHGTTIDRRARVSSSTA